MRKTSECINSDELAIIRVCLKKGYKKNVTHNRDFCKAPWYSINYRTCDWHGWHPRTAYSLHNQSLKTFSCFTKTIQTKVIHYTKLFFFPIKQGLTRKPSSWIQNNTRRHIFRHHSCICRSTYRSYSRFPLPIHSSESGGTMTCTACVQIFSLGSPPTKQSKGHMLPPMQSEPFASPCTCRRWSLEDDETSVMASWEGIGSCSSAAWHGCRRHAGAAVLNPVLW
jgi:hypothetical protein